VAAGFTSDRALDSKRAHDLYAKPPALWRIMRCAKLPSRAGGL
jgi:hypothetical protein